MKMSMNYKAVVILISLIGIGLFGVSQESEAQEAASSMSMGMARSGNIPEYEQIRIEEFINYHRHDIPMPSGDAKVCLDLKWSHLNDEQSILQVGMATPKVSDREMPPLNLVLVIDHSGSMSGDRIANVKKAILSFVERLRPTDQVSIVGFSTSASIVLSSCERTNYAEIAAAVQSLEADGSTNLNEGLMLGYKQAESHFDKDRSNRVILLTDGIANVGIVDVKQICAASKEYNKKGIDLSTIGLGTDLNQDLLRELADVGRGLIHFVGDSQDIEKTFVTELDSLLAPIGKKVKLTVELDDSSIKPQIFGYSPKTQGSKTTLKLENLNHGVTQVVLMKLKSQKAITIKTTLSYTDVFTGDEQKVEQSTMLVPCESKQKDIELLADDDLRKNYSIAVLADSIKEASLTLKSEDFRTARKQLKTAIKFAEKHCGKEPDEDVERMLDIVRTFREQIPTSGS